MNSGLHYGVAYIFIVGTALLGSLVFLKGFLLSRTVVNIKSDCGADFAARPPDNHVHDIEGCWMHGRFHKAIIVIIDALKYDFMTFNDSLRNNDAPPYKNKMKIIQELKDKQPLNTLMYKFIADPPTTTMQRLKGLTTGSLPTFVDAGANFHSSQILEDNFIDQLLSIKKKIKFFGDDTWMSLFPNKFHKAFDYPSFDVKDLHTVDNGILKHLYAEMRKSDWDVIIAHFLGVDHCGHKFGPDHPAMEDKLLQMNQMIRNVTTWMKKDTVLFIMGDHGMTRTGDHGGDSRDELEAGLFIYSPAKILATKQNTELEVRQTDFVPTLSLLLGTPIPFSNLGTILTPLFGHCPWWSTESSPVKQIYHKIKALRLNAHQVNKYLSAYQNVSSDLPKSKLRELSTVVEDTDRFLESIVTTMVQDGTSDFLEPFERVENIYIKYLKEAREMCEKIWAKFDLNLILTGISTISVSLFFGIYCLLCLPSTIDSVNVTTGFIFAGCMFQSLYVIFHISVFPESVPPLMAWILALTMDFVIILAVKSRIINILRQSSPSDIVTILSIALVLIGYFSNSYIVHEDSTCLYLIVSLLLTSYVQYFIKSSQAFTEQEKPTNRYSRQEKPKNLKLSKILFFVLLTICFLLRISSIFFSCREEQSPCENSIFLSPLASISNLKQNQRYFFSVLCLSLLVYSILKWLRYFGNLNGSSGTVLCIKYLSPLTVVFTSLYWAVQALSHTDLATLTQWQQAVLAQVSYVAILLILIAMLVSPLFIVNIVDTISSGLYPSTNIPTLYNQLKLKLNQTEEKPPMVYGLGSVYSASLVSLLLVVALLLSLLLGDGISPSLLLAICLLYLILEVFSVFELKDRSGSKESPTLPPSWTSIVVFCLLSTLFFYATGHQATIPSIRFEAAYVGFYGNFKTILLPGLLIWLNTFAGHVLLSVASPLLIFWPHLSTKFQNLLGRPQSAQDPAPWQGDFVLFNDAPALHSSLFKVVGGSVVFSVMKLLSASCAAALHRRHLMVWKIFAPRLVYEAAMFVTTSVVSCLVVSFILYVDLRLSRFVKSLPKDNS